MSANILALDVSLVNTGWAVVDAAARPEALVAHGCIQTAPDRQSRLKGLDDISRVSAMVVQLNAVIEAHRPAATARAEQAEALLAILLEYVDYLGVQDDAARFVSFARWRDHGQRAVG